MLHEIKNVEIFATGKWNGENFNSDDLDSIIKSFGQDKVGFEPPLKLGHDKKQELLQQDGYPAAGWIASLKRVGNKIVADFKNVPRVIKELIEKKAYKVVSSELYRNYTNKDGAKYPWVLKAVSILGEDIPAVEGLSDMIALYDKSEQAYYVFNLYQHDITPQGKSNNERRDDDMTDLERLKEEMKAKDVMLQKLEKQIAEYNKNSAGDMELTKNVEMLSKTLEETKKELQKETKAREVLEMERKKEKINAVIDNYVGKKISPAQAPILKEMLIRGNDNGDKILVFSKDGKEEKLSMLEGIERFISLQDDLFTTEVTKEGISTEDDDESKIRAYCKDKGLDFNNDDDYKKAYVNALN